MWEKESQCLKSHSTCQSQAKISLQNPSWILSSITTCYFYLTIQFRDEKSNENFWKVLLLAWHGPRKGKLDERGDDTRVHLNTESEDHKHPVQMTGQWSLVTGHGHLWWSKWWYNQLHGNPKILRCGGRFCGRMMS